MQYKDRLILFVDILGFTSLVYKSAADEDVAERIKTTLEYLEILFRKNYKGDSLEFSQFSDSIVISFPVDYPGGVYYIVTQASFAIHALFTNNFICKGVISVGKLYHQGDLLFGPEFLNVMKLEALEDLPRITFNEDILEIAKLCPGEGNKGYPNVELDYIKGHIEKVESSELYEVAWFKDYESLVGESEEHYLSIKTLLEENLKNYRSIRILKKYCYLKDVYNKFRPNNKIIYSTNNRRYFSLIPKHVIDTIHSRFVKFYWKMK